MTINLGSLTGQDVTTSHDGKTSLDLRKNDILNLTKAAPSLKRAHIGLQWDTGNQTCDLDLSVFALNANNVVEYTTDFLFYDRQVQAPGLQKSGDNRTGAGDGDDEYLDIDFDKISPYVQSIVLVVSIYDATHLQQTFGMVSNAKIHIDNLDTNTEITSYSLTNDYTTSTSVVFGKLVRTNEGWVFQAVGEGYQKELEYFRDLYVR